MPPDGLRVFECWGGPFDGQPLELEDHMPCYTLMRLGGYYYRGSGRWAGKLVWRQLATRERGR